MPVKGKERVWDPYAQAIQLNATIFNPYGSVYRRSNICSPDIGPES